MSITDYASLVASARQQEQPQRLLFTFTRAEAEPGGQGKSLTPVLCADKLPEELASFAALLEESKQMPTHWDVVFVAGLAGSGGQPPASQQCEAPLRAMVKAIEEGRIDSLLAFDRSGELLRFR
ncbi:ribonucleotide reductase subunit alpha [Janthinobacterium sp. PC23-8]|uniref:ribonucleotide reductase subunit alpha n=1 Tax=Janthinobacterium sp. PC23-8 TaxID=2012679 RepID=UPI000B977AC3|nr:ribonucleotide reductase subunit alpha [Janthinobacterium sp. PC23-8]OYO28582.1 ribonucleotide reductase subunit alpha [Janthinobacterium sp. PC23-8]